MVGMGKQQRRGWGALMMYSAAARKLVKKLEARAKRRAGKQEVNKQVE